MLPLKKKILIRGNRGEGELSKRRNTGGGNIKKNVPKDGPMARNVTIAWALTAKQCAKKLIREG